MMIDKNNNIYNNNYYDLMIEFILYKGTNMFNKKNIDFIYFINAFVMFLFFSLLIRLPNNQEGKIFGKDYNIIAYIAAIFLTFLIIAVELFIYNKRKNIQIKMGKIAQIVSTILTVFIFLVGLFYLVKIYDNEVTIYPYSSGGLLRNNEQIHWLYFFFLALFAASFVYISFKSRIRSYNRKLIITVLAILLGLMTFAPNPFLDAGGTLYHIHAYDNSIINIINGIPYDEYNISIYGHYGLLIAPFSKLIGGNYYSITLIISIISIITFWCVFFICDYFIETDIVFLGTIFAVGGIVTLLYQGGQYYQVLPHRIVFPVLTLVYIIKINNYTKKHYLFEFILGTLAVLWNLETGIFCLIVIGINELLLSTIIRKNSIRYVVAEMFKVTLLSILSIVSSYLVVVFYNYLCGYKKLLSVLDFIYPFGATDYSIEGLRLVLPTVFSVYVVTVVISGVIILDSFIHMKDSDDGYDSKKYIIKICIAISAICSMVYFINRTAYSNISIIWIQFIIMIAIIGDKKMNEENCSYIKKAESILALLLLFAIAIESLLYTNAIITSRLNSTWNTDSMDSLLKEIEENVPEDTIAFGQGVPEIYSELDWDTGVYCIDWSDMNTRSIKYVRETVSSYNQVFANISDWNSIGLDGYVITYQTQIGSFSYGLYEKVK